MTAVTIPQLDANLVDVTITRWNKTVGDTVSAGDVLAELTTDKAVYELECPADGTLLAVYASEKSVVPTGFIVGYVGDAGEIPPAAPQENDALMARYAGLTAVAQVRPREQTARVRATPKARRLAREHQLDLAKIQAETGVEVVDEATLAPYL